MMKTIRFAHLLVAAAVFLLTACAPHSAQQQVDESVRANQMFETFFQEDLARSPIYQTYLGIKTDYGKWDDLSESFQAENHKLTRDQLKRLNTIDTSRLDKATALSYTLQKQTLENEIADYQWRYHNYPINQMYGFHTMIPSLLINQHTIASQSDADAYISRLQGVPELINQVIDQIDIRTQKGIIPPRFVFPRVLGASENLLKGAPFSKGDDNPLFSDFKKKVNALQIAVNEKEALLNEAKNALINDVKPAYLKLIDHLKALEQQADTQAGVWKFPNGEAFYNNALERTTTTQLTADEVHQIGLDEVARIHKEMRGIMKTVNFKGDLQAFFKFMRTSKLFYYDEDEASKQAYLDKATQLIDNMKTRLDELFITKPKADLIVKRVEPFRENSAGKAFYQQPSMDGKRPGLYYANLKTMADMPTYQMEALAYHEGLPGHHMQIAIAQELEDIPKFRKFGRYTAYVEGWGLYSELVPKEMGLYENPYSDFGRLSMELWRACRLVVDTGIHAKRWTREKAINYLKENTPNPEGDVVHAIERYIVMPSQATAYKIGMLKILELRASAKKQLGDNFDIRQFHDVVLRNGPVPLNVLEQLVQDWVSQTQG